MCFQDAEIVLEGFPAAREVHQVHLSPALHVGPMPGAQNIQFRPLYGCEVVWFVLPRLDALQAFDLVIQVHLINARPRLFCRLGSLH